MLWLPAWLACSECYQFRYIDWKHLNLGAAFVGALKTIEWMNEHHCIDEFSCVHIYHMNILCVRACVWNVWKSVLLFAEIITWLSIPKINRTTTQMETKMKGWIHNYASSNFTKFIESFREKWIFFLSFFSLNHSSHPIALNPIADKSHYTRAECGDRWSWRWRRRGKTRK